jgi:UDP-glucose 4-epimerase
MDEFDVPHLVFSSSCSVYGNLSPDKIPVDEDTPLCKPESPYGATKRLGEEIIYRMVSLHRQMKAVSLRYFNPAGAHHSGKLGEFPGKSPQNLFPVLSEVALGKRKQIFVFGDDYQTRDGTCIRDYIHIEDLAKAHVLALRFLEKTEEKYSVFNLGTGKGISVLEAIHAYEKENGIKINKKITTRRQGDIPAIFSDCKKAIETLGWRPEKDLTGIVKSAYQWAQFYYDKQGKKKVTGEY